MIVASNPALASILHSVVGHQACRVEFRVINAATDQHNFELTPQMVSNIQSASLLVLSGGGLDRWLLPATPKNSLVFEQLGALRSFSTPQAHPVAHPSGGQIDPHFWLDPVHVALYLDKVAHAVYQTFPQHCILPKIQENISNFHLDVARLKQESVNAVRPLGIRRVVATHDAYHYFIAFLERQGVAIAYRAFYELHVGSRQWIELMQTLGHEEGLVIWDVPPFSTCHQLEAKFGRPIPQCLRLDPSGNLLYQQQGADMDYVQFYRAFLKGFQ